MVELVCDNRLPTVIHMHVPHGLFARTMLVRKMERVEGIEPS